MQEFFWMDPPRKRQIESVSLILDYLYYISEERAFSALSNETIPDPIRVG